MVSDAITPTRCTQLVTQQINMEVATCIVVKGSQVYLPAGISAMLIVDNELKPVNALNVSLNPSHTPTLSRTAIGSTERGPFSVPRQIPAHDEGVSESERCM